MHPKHKQQQLPLHKQLTLKDLKLKRLLKVKNKHFNNKLMILNIKRLMNNRTIKSNNLNISVIFSVVMQVRWVQLKYNIRHSLPPYLKSAVLV